MDSIDKHPWIDSDGTIQKHPLAIAIQTELIDDPTFSFNTVSCLDYYCVQDCNSFFPTKKGYSYDEELGNWPEHPDKNKSFFFWRTYNPDIPYDDPEHMFSHWKLFVLDGSINYNYSYSIKIIVELEVQFLTLTDEDISTIKTQTIDKLGISTDTIKNTSINQAGVYENAWIVDNLDSFRQQVFARTKTESDNYITRCLTREPVVDSNKTHMILILNPGIIDFDPYSELCYDLSDSRTLYGKFDMDEQAKIPIGVLGPDDETATDYHRRNLHYRRNQCVWGLLDCNCSSSGVCLKVENGRDCCCGFGGPGGGKVMSLGTDQSQTLEARMDRFTATEVM
jgi:hypothetical protein